MNKSKEELVSDYRKAYKKVHKKLPRGLTLWEWDVESLVNGIALLKRMNEEVTPA